MACAGAEMSSNIYLSITTLLLNIKSLTLTSDNVDYVQRNNTTNRAKRSPIFSKPLFQHQLKMGIRNDIKIDESKKQTVTNTTTRKTLAIH